MHAEWFLAGACPEHHGLIPFTQNGGFSRRMGALKGAGPKNTFVNSACFGS